MQVIDAMHKSIAIGRSGAFNAPIRLPETRGEWVNMERLNERCGPGSEPVTSARSRGDGGWVRAGYLVYVMGVVFDQLSTRLAISHPGIVESNPLTARLIEAGAWLAVDLVLMFVALSLCHFITETFSDGREFSLTFLMTYGSIRTIAAMWNVRLFLTTVSVL